MNYRIFFENASKSGYLSMEEGKVNLNENRKCMSICLSTEKECRRILSIIRLEHPNTRFIPVREKSTQEGE